jgi:hypothetical protein
MPKTNLAPGDHCEVVLHTGPNAREIVDGVVLHRDGVQVTVRLADRSVIEISTYHVSWVPSPDEIATACEELQQGWSWSDERGHRGVKKRDDESWTPAECDVREVLSGLDHRRVIVVPVD